MIENYTSKQKTVIYNYLKLLISAQIITEMQVELKGTSVWNGKIKTLTRELRTHIARTLDKDIERVFTQDTITANALITSIEVVATKLSNLDVLKLANLSEIVIKVQDDGYVLVHRDYYEDLEKIKIKYNKL